MVKGAVAMADAPQFDRALLRELALCFVDAAITRLLEESENGDKPLIEREILASRSIPGPALSTAAEPKNASRPPVKS